MLPGRKQRIEIPSELDRPHHDPANPVGSFNHGIIWNVYADT
jgi:hypothetical protein